MKIKDDASHYSELLDWTMDSDLLEINQYLLTLQKFPKSVSKFSNPPIIN